jgi:hypothetical protein
VETQERWNIVEYFITTSKKFLKWVLLRMAPIILESF